MSKADAERGAVEGLLAELNFGMLPADKRPVKIKATDTPEFKAWFKGSKVVDESGAPIQQGLLVILGEVFSGFADTVGDAHYRMLALIQKGAAFYTHAGPIFRDLSQALLDGLQN